MNFRFIFILLVCVTCFIACDDDEAGPQPPVLGSLEPNVGGPDQPNQVYVDLSTNEMSVVNRTSWDFGFSTSSDFRVILNGANGMLVATSGETDFAVVNAQLLDAFPFNVMSMDVLFGSLVSPTQPAWLIQSSGWADFPDGSLANTSIAEVPVDDATSEVYVVNRGKTTDGLPRGFIKIKITRNGNGYTVQHGNLDDATGTTINISKDANFNYSFLSIELGEVVVEPDKANWDLAFSTFTDHVLNNFVSGFPVPYEVNDFVFSNRNGVSVATVISTSGNTLADYMAFALTDASGLNSNDGINAIGTDWRTVMTPQVPDSVTAPRGDRFYIVTDGNGIKYKVLFTRMLNGTGERGFPEFTFEELR